MSDKLKRIKKTLKNKKLIELSVVDLMDYYERRRTSKKQKQIILELAKIKHEQNQEETYEWLKSGMFRLACEQLIKNKLANRVILNEEQWYYDANITDILPCMKDILVKAEKKCNKDRSNKIDLLKQYCEGIHNEFREI